MKSIRNIHSYECVFLMSVLHCSLNTHLLTLRGQQSINQAVWEKNSPARRLRNMSQCVWNQVKAQVRTDALMNSQKRWRTRSSNFQIVKMWVNEILTEETSRQRTTINSTISQFHKGGGTNKTSDQPPVVLLNSVYQLLNYVNNVNDLLKKLSNQLTS